MSGIIAHSGPNPAAPILLEGLRRLVHHGHDSAGLALLSRRRLQRWRALAPLAALERRIPPGARGRCGIAHTRLATHGVPEERNAHPHLGSEARVALVHNGIVENADNLRRRLRAEGAEFASDTDSEVLAELLERRLASDGGPLEEAVRAVLDEVTGTCGLAVLDRETPERIVVARLGSPMSVGGDATGGAFAASDAAALRGWVLEPIALEDGETATLSPNGVEMFPRTGGASARRATPAAVRSGASAAPARPREDEEEPHRRLHREILETPDAVSRALAGRLDRRFAGVRLGGLNLEPAALRAFRRARLLGCGSAWHAALSGARMIESLARLPATADPAGEFLYGEPCVESDTLYLLVSRSGETHDTLAALREIRARGGTALGIVNDVGSAVAREVHGGVYLHAGVERSIVATKTVSAMLAVFALLALHLGRLRDVSPQRGARLLEALDGLPLRLEETLAEETRAAAIARALLARSERAVSSVLFVGRAAGYAIALEGARKLTEASGVHAAACSGAELAHGPIALLGADTPCVVLLPEPDLLPLSLSSLERIKARGAPLVVVGDGDAPRVAELADHRLRLPRTEPLLQPIVAGATLQLLAYHAGRTLGHDIDRSGTLARRVTLA